jgi:hypothetical protein
MISAMPHGMEKIEGQNLEKDSQPATHPEKPRLLG